ncbi:Retrovirus-related Pol polyprotein from transposon TNT 1-94 [Sesamum angolense]|uniref:Retrovirus-related Pol polyprotein from transposon TNT 1-94 n=1 Tax=Sesamum angolense TaxID=2727404 RepID=A0AAE2BP75_9LAMI|nr:Retrovirus-related Pol polyprotein from transposon TNT 1-94 [Sesamum angolense]
MDKSCVLSRELCPKTKEKNKLMAKIPYARVVGSLMYAMMCTRPDLCFAVRMVSRESLMLVGYIDADGSEDRDECKSTSGYAYLLGATIAYAKNKYHRRTKHICNRYHFIRDSIAQGEVVLRHISTNDMIVDPFTNPLLRDT